MILKDVRLRALRSDPTSFTEVLADVECEPDAEWAQWAAAVSSVDGDSAVFLGFDAERTTAVGMAGGFVRDTPHDDARVFGVWVDPVARGTGIARLLVQEVISWARTTGRARLTLCVMESSVAAIALYRSVGFEEEGCTVPSRIHDGASERAMTMSLREG